MLPYDSMIKCQIGDSHFAIDDHHPGAQPDYFAGLLAQAQQTYQDRKRQLESDIIEDLFDRVRRATRDDVMLWRLRS